MNARRWVGDRRQLRRVAYAALRLRARAVREGDSPPIFVNSFPKAGTHMLMSALDATPNVLFSGRFLVPEEFSDQGENPPGRDMSQPSITTHSRPSLALSSEGSTLPPTFGPIRSSAMRSPSAGSDRSSF